VTVPVDPVAGTASGPDQRRTLIAPAHRGQPVIDRRIVGGHGPAQGSKGASHGRDIDNGAPGAVLGEPPPEPDQAEGGADYLVVRHHLGRAACQGHARELGIEAAGMDRGDVRAGQAGLTQGKVARMDPGVACASHPAASQ
jgi:hypothetical protein